MVGDKNDSMLESNHHWLCLSFQIFSRIAEVTILQYGVRRLLVNITLTLVKYMLMSARRQFSGSFWDFLAVLPPHPTVKFALLKHPAGASDGKPDQATGYVSSWNSLYFRRPSSLRDHLLVLWLYHHPSNCFFSQYYKPDFDPRFPGRLSILSSTWAPRLRRTTRRRILKYGRSRSWSGVLNPPEEMEPRWFRWLSVRLLSSPWNCEGWIRFANV